MPLVVLLALAHAARADYVVLRNGQRLQVTGYELLGDKYKLQMVGGFVEVPVSEVASIEPQDVFTPVIQGKAATQAPYREMVEQCASRYGVDADLISSVMAVESNFNPKAVSRKNARGLMQLLPETAAQLGVKDIFDPQENIDAGTRYLRTLLLRYNNDLALTLAAYNAGPQRVQLYGRVPPFPETISYVRRVKNAYRKRKSSTPGKPDKTAAAPSTGEVAGTSTPKSGQL